ncbi:MAG: hypothetical protein LQ350_002281 [Teloschistes chrysophthalmus]|nr:MAG: hypothetical protein LQ350_002281 [Niorma chrysophthalma]
MSQDDPRKSTSRLASARILIIGGTSGLGFAVASASLEHGAQVIISSSRESRVSSAIARLTESHPSARGRISGHPCDLASPAILDENIKSLLEKTGPEKLDHVIITAGDGLVTVPLAEWTVETIQTAGVVRFVAPLLFAKHAPAHLSPGPTSSITLTTGSVSEKPLPGWTIPASYAGGMHSMMRNLALDLRPIRVNLVSPGFVATEMWEGMDEGEYAALMEEQKKRTTTGEVGRAEDVAESYLYCMRDRNLSGSVISTNGGALLMGKS